MKKCSKIVCTIIDCNYRYCDLNLESSFHVFFIESLNFKQTQTVYTNLFTNLFIFFLLL